MGQLESLCVNMSTCGEPMSTSSLNTLEVNMADQSSTLPGAKRKLTLEGVNEQES